ncbi:MAG: DUF308 domain-containing protein [Bacillota bacterium]
MKPTSVIGVILLIIGFLQLLTAVRTATRSGTQLTMYLGIFLVVAGFYFLFEF